MPSFILYEALNRDIDKCDKVFLSDDIVQLKPINTEAAVKGILFCVSTPNNIASGSATLSGRETF